MNNFRKNIWNSTVRVHWSKGDMNLSQCRRYSLDYSGVAQSVEHSAVNRGVVGSSPTARVSIWRGEITMKARIIESGCMFEGQVRGESYNIFSGKMESGWVTVTSPCFTRWGAKRELQRWKRKKFGETLDI